MNAPLPPSPLAAPGSASGPAPLDEAHRLLCEALHLARFYNPHLERRIRRFLDADGLGGEPPTAPRTGAS